MFQEVELWSPEQELRLLEEMAEAEAQAFDLEMDLPLGPAHVDSERPWVAYWQLPPNGIRPRGRINQRPPRGR